MKYIRNTLKINNMKQIDYKKKFNEALDRAKTFSQKWEGVELNSDLALKELKEIFPELKESEDEKMRKGLICFIKAEIPQCNARDKYIAWLKKQGDKVTQCKDISNPNGGIVLEDFNGGEGFYKIHLDYLNKKQVEEIEELVRTWNTDSNSFNNENIRACIGLCLTDADEQRFKNHNTNLKECIAWLDKQCEKKFVEPYNNEVKQLFIKALERVEELNAKGYKLTDCDKNCWWEDFKACLSKFLLILKN